MCEMKKLICYLFASAACSIAAMAQFSWQTAAPTETVPPKGEEVEKVIVNTVVDDWGRVVKSIELTVKHKAVLKKLEAKDFNIVNNALNSFYDPATGQPVQPFQEDGISIEKQGSKLVIKARPFDVEGSRNPNFRKSPWRVECSNSKLNFSMLDVDQINTEVIDDCIKGSFTFAGITREYMLYLPKDEDGNTIPNVPLFVWQIGGGEYNQPMMVCALANKCLASLPQHGQKCATLVFAIANPNYSYSASLDPEKIKLIDRNNALQMAFIDQLVAEGKVDGSRLFCAGASSGGGCTMRFMMQFAHRFKAAIPICAMDPIVPIHKVEESYPGQFADDVEKVWKGNCVYRWDGNDMVAGPMDIDSFVKLPMYFAHAQDDATCKVISTYSYFTARKRLGARDDKMVIYSDADMKEYGFGGFLAHFSWCRVLNDYNRDAPMDWLIKQF